MSDETPQLGGNLDVNGNQIVTDSDNENIVLNPHGTGTVDVSTSRITSVTDPTGAQDAATKNYTDTTFMPFTGGTFTGDIVFNSGQTIDGYVPRTSTTGSAELPSGTEDERDDPASAGYIRFNTTVSQFEGFNGTDWASVGGGATGGGSDEVFVENAMVVTTDYELASGKSAPNIAPASIIPDITFAAVVPEGITL